MKGLLLVFTIMFGFSSYGQIPDLVNRTLKFELKSKHFYSRENVFLNVDTSTTKESIWDFNHQEFKKPKKLIREYSNLKNFISSKKIGEFYTFGDSLNTKKPDHWVLIVSEGDKVYKIDWWFSEYDVKKLKGLTILLIEKGTI